MGAALSLRASRLLPGALGLPTVLAAGAFLKNTAGLLRGGAFAASAAHGDLSTPQACMALEQTLDALAAPAPDVAAVAHDLHPDFASTRLAQAMAARLGVPAIGCQHHAAHIAVVLAEQAIETPVIGLALDGFGLGQAVDVQGFPQAGAAGAWGGEMLWMQRGAWRRLGHLHPLPLAGGDKAALQPWRMAAAAMHALGRGADIPGRFAPTIGALAEALPDVLSRGLNCPPTTSAGRWFDAAAAALGLNFVQTHEAEAAMVLEAAAARSPRAAHAHARASVAAPVRDGVVDLRPVLAALLDAPQHDGRAVADAALDFHLALADGLACAAAQAAAQAGIDTVVLGGGCFFNLFLSRFLTQDLQARGLTVLRPEVNCGDADLALGQAWMAAQQLLGH